MEDCEYVIVCSDGYRHQQVWSKSMAMVKLATMRCKNGPHKVVPLQMEESHEE